MTAKGETAAGTTNVARSALDRALILAIVVGCGAIVMEVEILGARVIGPWFGVSLFVWTALITVTLLSLALGYYLGGRIADRFGSLRTMGAVVGGAGITLLAVPLLRVGVLRAAQGAGLKTGALLAAAALFGPTLILLGMVSPLAIRLFLDDIRRTGRTVGRLAAVSTVGSFVGTVASGFWIVPAFHVNQITAGAGVLLLLLGAGAFARHWRRPLVALLPLPLLLLAQAPPLATAVLASGTRAEIVARRGSFYGHISVVDYVYEPRHTREMLIDGIVQGGIDLANGESIYEYPYALEEAMFAANPAATRVLVIGLGPGAMPMRLSRLGLSGTVVEIDPAVVIIARDYFGFSTGAFPVAPEDGRYFLARTHDRFDAVLLDAFAAENEPTHLLTQQAFKAIAGVLEPGGVLAINLSGRTPAAEVDNTFLDSVLRTMSTVFPKVAAYYGPAEGVKLINFTLVGSLSGGRPAAGARPALPPHPMASAGLDGMFERRYVPSPSGGCVYTDEWAPVEFHAAELKLLWRQALIAATPSEILLD